MDLINIFNSLLSKNRLPQSILIECRDSDKSFNLALNLAKKILKDEKFSLNHPDLFLIKPDKNIKIEDIKAIQEFCYLTPQTGDSKVIIIHRAEKFTVEAANSILKILEEPVKKRFFILTVVNKNQLLPTILSRCVCFKIKPNKSELDYFRERIPLEIFKKATNFFKTIESHNLTYYDIFTIVENLYKNFDKVDDFLKFLILLNDNLLNGVNDINKTKNRANLINFFIELYKMFKININYKNILILISIYIKNRNFLKGEMKIG